MSAHSRRDEFKGRVVGALRDGHTRKAAAALAGISKDTFYRWLREDSDFSDSCTRAESLVLAECESQVFKASQRGEWRAAAWWLERRDPEHWGRRATIASAEPLTVHVVRQGPQWDLSKLDEADRAMLVKLAEKAGVVDERGEALSLTAWAERLQMAPGVPA